MDLYLHIGMEKTGTTALQEAVYQNSEMLEEHNIGLFHNIGKPNNRDLVYYVNSVDLQDDFYTEKGLRTEAEVKHYFQGFEEKFDIRLTELAGRGISSVIISSEHFHSRLVKAEDAHRLYEFLRPRFSRIVVILYLRDQVSACKSLYSTALKFGHKTNARDFLNTMRDRYSYFDYGCLIERWSIAFGRENITVNIFHRSSLLGGSIITDFFSAIGHADVAEKMSFSKATSNESLGGVGEAVLKFTNSIFPAYVDGAYVGRKAIMGKILRKAIMTMFGPFLKLGKIKFDPVATEAFSAHYRPLNEKLREEYGIVFPSR